MSACVDNGRVCVLVTRPPPGLEKTAQLFRRAGFLALPCPMLVIRPVENQGQARRQLRQVADWETLIFPSQHAVEQAFSLLPDWRLDPATRLVAVGRRTAHRLCDHLPQDAPNTVLVPDRHNSEGVIELLSGMRRLGRVAIITAAGGRRRLRDWLSRRPEQPAWSEVFVYQRGNNRPRPECVSTVMRHVHEGLPVFTLATSASIVASLLRYWPGDVLPGLQRQPLVCASERIAIVAADAGFHHCLVAEGAAPRQLLAAVQKALGKT